MKTLVNKFHGAVNKVAAFALAISMMVGLRQIIPAISDTRLLESLAY